MPEEMPEASDRLKTFGGFTGPTDETPNETLSELADELDWSVNGDEQFV